ncbi:glycosyl hydrolase catalytic core-domain-containing protein [Cytidiella melzeri]|nr:glycosyl hydrolase catalytic core-domain-containing protein [Cytidiella melzeri]
MKFAATFLSIVFCVAATVEAHAHIGRYHRRGPSATFPSTTPTPTPSTAPPSNPGAKRGVSFNDVAAANQFGSKITWAYNWAATHDGTLNPGIKFAPMLWGIDQSHTANWANDATAAIAAGATHLLGFNEPDLGAQSNISPEDAAKAWKTYMQPFAGKAALIAPAVTNGAAPMGLAWLDSFLAACDTCTIDAIAIHIYDSATNVAYFQNYISDAASKYGKPVWVTEFGASGTVQQQQTFLQTMLPFLDNLSGVQCYAYFMAGSNILTTSSNQITALGTTYNTV